MICPEGYFAPSALEDAFERTLSNDRIAPKIFQSANANFDAILSADRAEVLKITSKLFTHIFIKSIESKAQVFCPTKPNPYNAGTWLLRTKDQAPTQLPESLMQSGRDLGALYNNFAFICSRTWSVDKELSIYHTVGPNKNEAKLLEKIDSWSLCFRSDLLPTDYGSMLEKLATAMAQRNRSSKRQEKKRGRQSKVAPIVEALHKIYPENCNLRPAKAIRRDLNDFGINDFGDTTLNQAISIFKKNMITKT